MPTQVGIIGAGPAGLMLSHLLAQNGIASVVLEARSRSYVEQRVRAGVLEQGTVDTLIAAGVGDRMQRQGLVHHGIELRFGGASHRIPFERLVPGRAITVYGQQEVVKDLIAARLAAGGEIRFEASDVALDGIGSESPRLRFVHEGEEHELTCDFIAGCDGFHGVARTAVPAGVLSVYEREYPFAWLGILATVAPSTHELIYAQTERGFALHSMRSPELSRFYLQVAQGEDIERWPDARIWSELRARLETVPGFSLRAGPIIEKGITALRSFVCEPMQYGRLFLAGDAAHIVPPTGAKGLNLAVADVRVLCAALTAWYQRGDRALLESYSKDCLWMTALLHTFPGEDPYAHKLQRAYLDYVTSSPAAATTLAENYVGFERPALPLG